jgi:hypothetical protein
MRLFVDAVKGCREGEGLRTDFPFAGRINSIENTPGRDYPLALKTTGRRTDEGNAIS